MGVFPLGGEGGALVDAEAMLLVHHRKSQSGEIHPLGEQRVGSHHHLHLP